MQSSSEPPFGCQYCSSLVSDCIWCSGTAHPLLSRVVDPCCQQRLLSTGHLLQVLVMFRPTLRALKPIRPVGRRSASSNARSGVSPVLPTSTVVVGLVGVVSAAYAYGLGLGKGRTTTSTHVTSSSKPKYGGPEQVEQAIKELQAALPGQVHVDPLTVEAYGFSPHTYLPSSPHAVYVAATSTEDVVKIVNISRKYKVPIIPFGVGNSLEGQFAGVSPWSLI